MRPRCGAVCSGHDRDEISVSQDPPDGAADEGAPRGRHELPSNRPRPEIGPVRRTGLSGTLRSGRSRLAFGALATLLCLVLGIAIVTQVRQTKSGDSLDTARPADLLVLLDSLRQREATLNTEVSELQNTLNSLRASGNSDQAAIQKVFGDGAVAVGVNVHSMIGTRSFAVDGDTETFWHSRWSKDEAKPPHFLVIDYAHPLKITGLHYVARTDMDNGHVKDYELYASLDGKDWAKPVARGQFEDDPEETIHLAAPVRARYLKFVMLSEQQGRAIASVAELSVEVAAH